MAESQSENIIAETGLVRAIGVRGLAANTVNNVIGSGIFVLPAVIAATLGPAAIIAYIICAVAIGLIGLTFAEAGSRVAAPGGLYAYAETAFGPFVGFLNGVLFCLSQVSANAAIATVFAGSLAAISPALGGTLSRATIVVLLYFGLAILNLRGVRSGMHLVEALTTAKLLPLVLLVVVGLVFIAPRNLVWTSTPTVAQFGSASLLLIFAFTGVEGALTSSGEVVNPSRTVPRAIMLGLGTVSLLYIAIQLVAQGVLGPDLTLDQSAPLIALAGRTMGSAGRLLLAAGAAISAFGYVSGDILTTPRLLFAFGRDGLLPRQLAKVSEKHHSPAVAIVVYTTLVCVLAISGTFTTLVVLSTVSILLVYLATCLASIQLSRRDVRADGAPFHLPGGPVIPLLACLVVIWMLTSASRREFMSVGVALVIASVLYAIRPRRSVSAATPG